MRKYSTNGEAISLGCWAICRFAAENGGFVRCSVGKEIVEVVLTAMKTFPLNAGVQAYCCLGLGWACYGHEGAAKYALKLGAKEAIDEAKKVFLSSSQLQHVQSQRAITSAAVTISSDTCLLICALGCGLAVPQNLPMDAGVWGNASWAVSNIMPVGPKDAPAEIHKRLILDRRLLGIKYMQGSNAQRSDGGGAWR